MGGRGLLEQQFRRFFSHKYPQYRLGGGGAEVGGARKRKQLAPRKAFPPKKMAKLDSSRDGDRYIGLVRLQLHMVTVLSVVLSSSQGEDDVVFEVSVCIVH